MDVGATTSSVADSGMTDFGAALAPLEDVLTISGATFSMDGVPEDRGVARGADHQVREALVTEVPYTLHGALAQVAGAGHGADP